MKQHTWQVKNFPSDLKKEFKSRCAREETSMASKLEELVRNYVYELEAIKTSSITNDEFCELKRIASKLIGV